MWNGIDDVVGNLINPPLSNVVPPGGQAPYSSAIEKIRPGTADWWRHAGQAERSGFVAGFLVSVGIGLVVAGSCVLAVCSGLWLVAAGSVATLGGSVGSGLTYIGVTRHLGGTPTQAGLSAAFFWGGIGGSLGFMAGMGLGQLSEGPLFMNPNDIRFGGSVAGDVGPEDLAEMRVSLQNGEWSSVSWGPEPGSNAFFTVEVGGDYSWSVEEALGEPVAPTLQTFYRQLARGMLTEAAYQVAKMLARAAGVPTERWPPFPGIEVEVNPIYTW